MKKLIPPKAPLNIVPFIDIMLVLLCIVLSVSTFIAQGSIKVTLPESSTQSSGENHEKPALLEGGSDNTIIYYCTGECGDVFRCYHIAAAVCVAALVYAVDIPALQHILYIHIA